MDISKIKNKTVKKAYEAWQNGDKKAFLSHFTSNPKLLDDGEPRDFDKFVNDACGVERFTEIEKVEDNGKAIYGPFHTESWGDFNCYFKFNLNADDKIETLEIGNTDK